MSNELRVLIGDRAGLPLAEIEVGLDEIPWRLNQVGRFDLVMSANDPKASRVNLMYGNLVLIQFANGLPNFAGVLDPPREWRGDGMIRSSVYSANHILSFRSTNRGRYFSDATAGTIADRLLTETNSIAPTNILPGEIWQGGKFHSPSYHLKNLLSIYQDSICGTLENADYDVTGYLNNSKINFELNLYETQGTTRSNLALVEGANVGWMRVYEQGPIRNSVEMAGEGTTWGPDRVMSSGSDAASMGLYGLRQRGEIRPGVTEQSTLDNAAAIHLAQYKDPHSMIELEALDLAPATFAQYGLGDRLRLIAPSYNFGYDGLVRIIARSYLPGAGRCTLIVREVVA